MEDETSHQVSINIEPENPYITFEQRETIFYKETTETNAKFWFETMYNMVIKRDYATHDKIEDKCSVYSISELMIYILFEFYKGTIGIYLIVFVPQQCLNTASDCGLFDNTSANPHYTTAFSINIITSFFFLLLHLLELWREYKITSYLRINKTDKSGILGIHASPDSEKLIDDQLHDFCDEDLPEKCPIYNNFITNKLIVMLVYYNTIYKYAIVACIMIFTINAIYSSSVIIAYNTKNQSSYIGIITNISVYLPKLYDISSLVALDKMEFSKNTYSSYKKIFAQYNNYNDDARKLIKIELDRQREFYVENRNRHMEQRIFKKYKKKYLDDFE
jgi:hypothetical protein